MPGIFMDLKFQALVYYWVCNMKLCWIPPPPPIMYAGSTAPPWALDRHLYTVKCTVNVQVKCGSQVPIFWKIYLLNYKFYFTVLK